MLSTAVALYHGLILNTPASGLLIPASCLLIAMGFSFGALRRNLVRKIIVSLLASFIAIAGGWWIHTALASGPTNLTPILIFEYGTPLLQVLGMTFIATSPLAVLGNLIDLSLEQR